MATELLKSAQGLPLGITRELGPPGHPIADLRRLAVRLGATAAATSDFSDIAGLPGPQLLHELGQRFGLEIALVNRVVDELLPQDCPCIVLLKDGSSRLLLEAPAAGAWLLAGDGDVPIRVARATLAAQASGGLFQARKIEPDLRNRASARPAAAAMRAEAFSSALPQDDHRHPLAAHLLRTAGEKKQLVLALAIAGLLSGLINLAVPIFTMVVFDRVIPHGAFETLWALILGVGMLLVIDLALRHVRHSLGDAVSLAASTSFGARFFSRLLHAPLSSMPRQAGGLVQPFQELNQAATIAPQFIAGLMVDIPFFLIVLAFLGALGGWIAAIPAIGVVLLLIIHWVGHRLQMQDLGDEARLSQRQTQMIVDAVMAAEPVRINGSGPQLLMRWEERSDAAAFAGHKLRSRQNFANHAGAFVMQAVTVATIAAGAYAVTASLMTVGALSACMMLASRAIMPVATVMGQGFRLKQIFATTTPLAGFSASPPEQGGDTSDAAAARPVISAFDFSRVGFAHSGAPPLMAGLDLALKAGERVAVIGKSGSGKSTLLKLMVRLHEVTEGAIHVDGRDIRQIDPLTLRRAVALMPQDSWLSENTLEGNMKSGLGPVSDEWFSTVADITGIADLANRNPSGYSLEVGPGGQRLSGGERQSVALARAMMGQPKLLLLDEPTSAMDNEREMRIVKALADQLRDGTLAHTGMIIATHRLPILALVDRIIWMDGGKIVADGPKDEIFRKFGLAA
jgi:ATP-binding cassette, subfamily C, bacterial LapB